MNFGKGISISQENDMLIGGNWLPAGTDKQFLVRSQPVPVDKQVNQAGRTNWQALLGFPGGHETQNCNGVVQNLNLVDLGGLSQTLYNWDGNFAEKNRLINHIAGSYNQNFVNGDTSTYKHILTDGGSRVSQSQPFANSDGTGTYSQALANVGPGIYSQALANGCTVPYSQALANGSTIPYSQALANGGTVPYSQALANGGTIPYGQALANGGTNNYGQAGTNNYSQALALANGGTNNYSQTLALANGGTSTYSQTLALANGGTSTSSQALANGGTIYYQGLGNGSTIYDQGLANSGTSSYSQAFVNGSTGAYSRLIGNGSAGSGNLAIGNGDAALYSQAMHNGDIDLNEYSLQDLLGLASSASVDRSSVQAANRPPALKPSASEALSRSIHTANRPLVLKTSASEAQNRNFHVANGPLVRKATTGEAPERSLLNASRPQVPNSHSQFEINWGEDNSIDMLLGKENQCSGSSMWKNSNGLLQIPEYGFPIPYQPSFNLNSPPGVEADATSSITNSFPCPPVTPERPKKILNFSADEGSSPDKNQEYITSTTNGATENHCDELLHNIVASSSAAPPSPCKGKNIVAKEGDEGIDLNKTPKQKQPKKRKHRPKVVIEGKPKKTPKPKVVIGGKPKKTPKPKVPSNSNPKENPTGKRKYVRKNKPKVPVTDPTDVRKEIPDPSFASATAKSCKRVLNFGEEKSGDGQHDVASQQEVMQQEIEPTFTLNLTSQTKEPCTGINIISGTKVAMQNDQQNELVVKSRQMSAVESQQISADYIAMLKRYTPAAQPTTENLQLGNLNVISRTVNKGNADPRQRNSKNAYVPIPQHIHADGIGQIVIQPLTTQENLDSSRRQMMQSTSQTNKFANSNQATGSKRDYCHTIEQSQAHAAHLIGPSLCQEIFQVNEYNSSNLCKVFSDMQKKRKTEKAAYTNMSTMASYTTAGEDELHRAEAKSVNRLTSQINHGILNICFEGNNDSQNLANGVNKTTRDSSMHQTAAGNSMWKHHISNEWPSQTEDMREKQVNGCTQLHSLTVLTAAAKDKLQPPAPIKAQSYSSGQHSIESCRVITLAEKQKEPLLSNSHSSSTYKSFLQEPKDKLYDYHQPSIKKRGRPAKKKQPDPIDAIIERLKSLELNDTSNETVGQEENAIILYKGDGAIIPYEIKKRKPRPKVDLDLETERVWKLLMGAEQDVGDSDERKAKWWEEEREVFRGRADSFIARMHLVQGDRRFSPWKGSVVDSVIGVFLTQNVSDHLSSSAFMSLVSRFPLHPESNKTSYSNEASILVEEPEVCIMNPDDTIKWHEKVSHQQVYNQAFVASSESSEHRRDSPDSGTSETSLVGAPNQRAEEEVMSSQDSVNSSVVQTTVLRSCSGSNSEAEDPTTGHKTNKVQASASTNILYMEKTFMSQECQYHANKSSNFDENTMRYRKQNPRLDRVDNHTESSSLTYLINSGNSNKQAPAVPSSNYRLHMTPDSGILEVECLQVLGEESISSWPSAASGIANPKDVNWTSKGTQQMTESIRKTTAQQHGLMNLQEATVGNPNALLRNYPMQQSSMQPGCTTENDKQSCKNHDLERTKTFQMQSMPSREPLKPAEALDTRRDTTMHQIPNVPKLTEEASNVRERDSAVDKQICLENEVLEPLSREQVHSSNKESGGTTTNILKPKKEKVEGTKKKAFDWDSLRKQVQANGRKRERSKDTMDSLDYEAIRCAHVNVISEAIKERGMNNMLAERIKDFLNRLVRDHGSIDLEWLRDSPPDKAKDYLLSIRGLGLKSVECVRLLTLHQLAFPVDTNVGRIAVRLGWVPLQPLPESLQLHLLELYPMLESIQKYLWPRLCKLDQRTLYELHYQLITFGKVFCTKHKPNCNACPMRGECRHFASAFASARLALPAPEEKSIVSSTAPSVADRNPTAFINPIPLPSLESNLLGKEEQDTSKCEPIIEVPATPEPQCIETLESDIEDAFYEDPDEIPTIKLNFEEFTLNLQNYMQENMELQEGDMSKALVALDPKATSIPTPKLKNVSRLRTEHQVYELPDSHPLLKGMDIREPDDPSPYLLAIWTPGETANSSQPPERRCESQEPGKLCNEKTCFSCNSLREANSQTVRGTLLIPCRTAMRGSFPLNGTYFQVNEVFADHDSSINPIDVPRAWIWNLPRRTVYFGTSVTSIFRGLPTEGIQYCFWRGFVCVRGFDQKSRAPRPLMARLHLSANKLSKTKNENN